MKGQLHAARFGRNIIFGVAVVMLAANLLLAGKLFTSSNQVVLVPTSIRDGMVARGAVDKRYLEALAMDAVYGLYNASPANLEYGRNVIERISAVGNRQKLLRHYDDVANDIRERDISTVFYVGQIEHSFENMEVVVEGNLQTYLNTVLVAAEPRRILLTFTVEAGSARLNKINVLEMEK